MRTRFAPSPTGPLHLGHAYSALVAHQLATKMGGLFLLRIEDIDQTRARPIWEEQIFNDLSWLGLSWPEPVLRQSQNMQAYRTALDHLAGLGVLYPCTCTRRDIQQALSAPQEGHVPLTGPDGLIYPGTCRSKQLRQEVPENSVLRLNMCKAIELIREQNGSSSICFSELSDDREVEVALMDLPETVGDIVLARRDFGTSYHLSVVVDDAAQDISHVVRGMDLFDATKIHVVLQSLLDLPTPAYLHHRLIRDDAGKRLAKRDDARALATYRDQGKTPRDIRRMLGFA